MRLDFHSGRAHGGPAAPSSRADMRPAALRLAPKRPGIAWRINATTRRPECRWTLDGDKPPPVRAH